MPVLRIENYVIDTPLIDIIRHLKSIVNNGKLRDIEEKADEIRVTCPNDDHAGGCESNPDYHITLVDDGKLPYGFFHCFACDVAGTFDHFVALTLSSSDAYARSWLIKNYGSLDNVIPVVCNRIKVPNTMQFTKVTTTIQEDLSGYQPWTPYLQSRRIPRQVAELFNVKYDPKYRQVIFPCYDKFGNLVMTPKRNIDNKIFYLNASMTKPVYCIDYIVKHNIKQLAIVEGPIDCLTCYANNIPAVATLGQPSNEQIAEIGSLGITSVWLMFDNDAAGRAFAAAVKAKLDKRILVKMVTLPSNRKDINDLTHDEVLKLIEDYKLPQIKLF